MAALSADRDTPVREGTLYEHPVAASVVIYAGALVMLDASGNAKPGAVATGQIAAGRADKQVSNAGGAAGAKTVPVRKGVFRFASGTAGDAITRAEIGDVAYIIDDQTIGKTDGTGTRSAAGTIQDVDANGVWVRIA